jgi:hypothetical protein
MRRAGESRPRSPHGAWHGHRFRQCDEDLGSPRRRGCLELLPWSRGHRDHAYMGAFIMTPGLEFIPENGGGAGIPFRKRKGP